MSAEMEAEIHRLRLLVVRLQTKLNEIAGMAGRIRAADEDHYNTLIAIVDKARELADD